MGAGQVLDPRGGPDGSPLAMAQPPDVSIEVSGDPRAYASIRQHMPAYVSIQPPVVSIEVSGNPRSLRLRVC